MLFELSTISAVEVVLNSWQVSQRKPKSVMRWMPLNNHHDNQPVRQSTLAVEPKGDMDAQLRTLTAGGQRPGTPLYMSPEQVDGSRGIDERTDMFSVGVVLYESLALREPFRGQDIDETFHNIKHLDVPPPSERAPDAGISPELDAIVMKALQKKPSNRYQTMRDLIAALNSLR